MKSKARILPLLLTLMLAVFIGGCAAKIPEEILDKSVLTAEVGDAEVKLSWTKVSGATHYQLILSKDGMEIVETDTIKSEATVKDLINDSTYSYFIKALAENGDYSVSDTVTVTPTAKPPVITFSDIKITDETVIGGSPELSGTISSTAKIDSVKAVIKDEKGTVKAEKEIKPDCDTLSLKGSELEKATDFKSLAIGRYKLSITVVSGETTETTELINFRIKSDINVTFDGLNLPSKMQMGKSEDIAGTVTSTAAIDSIRAIIKDKDGNIMADRTVKPAENTYDLKGSQLYYELMLGILNPGKYTLTFIVKSGTATEESAPIEFEMTINESMPTAAVDKDRFQQYVYNYAMATLDNNYEAFNDLPAGGWAPGDHWCGYYVCHVLMMGLLDSGIDFDTAYTMIPYYMLGMSKTCADYLERNQGEYGRYYSFADWRWEETDREGHALHTADDVQLKVGSVALIEVNGIAEDGPDHFGIIVQVNDDGSFVCAEGNIRGEGDVYSGEYAMSSKVGLVEYERNDAPHYGGNPSWTCRSNSFFGITGIFEPYFLL